MENLENEIWKVIPTIINKNGSYEPIGYEVSNMGRVRTKRQRYGRPRKDTGIRKELRDYHILNGRSDSGGYIQHALYNAEKNKRNFRTSTLVMQAFIGIAGEGQVISHIDGNKLNNCLDNLKYNTHQ
jgi:hypothetical protein